MSKPTKWKYRGFDDKQHYAGWLWFNDLTDDCKMHDDVYYDEYSGKIVNIVSQDQEEQVSEDDDAEEFLSKFEEQE